MTNPDTVQHMITDDIRDSITALDRSALMAGGLRAAWLHLTLTGAAADALSPRDREVLAVVATHPHGASQRQCLNQLRRMGVGEEAGARVIRSLARAGWLDAGVSGAFDAAAIGDPGEVRVDLPVADREWISQQVQALSQS